MAHQTERPRVWLGVPMTMQVIALLVAALGLTALLGYAVLRWLESTA